MPDDVRVYRHYGLDASLWVDIAPLWVEICVPEDVRVYRHYGFDAPLWVENFFCPRLCAPSIILFHSILT